MRAVEDRKKTRNGKSVKYAYDTTNTEEYDNPLLSVCKCVSGERQRERERAKGASVFDVREMVRRFFTICALRVYTVSEQG